MRNVGDWMPPASWRRFKDTGKRHNKGKGKRKWYNRPR